MFYAPYELLYHSSESAALRGNTLYIIHIVVESEVVESACFRNLSYLHTYVKNMETPILYIRETEPRYSIFTEWKTI